MIRSVPHFSTSQFPKHLKYERNVFFPSGSLILIPQSLLVTEPNQQITETLSSYSYRWQMQGLGAKFTLIPIISKQHLPFKEWSTHLELHVALFYPGLQRDTETSPKPVRSDGSPAVQKCGQEFVQCSALYAGHWRHNEYSLWPVSSLQGFQEATLEPSRLCTSHAPTLNFLMDW